VGRPDSGVVDYGVGGGAIRGVSDFTFRYFFAA